MGYNLQESLENTINTMGTLLGVHPIVPWQTPKSFTKLLAAGILDKNLGPPARRINECIGGLSLVVDYPRKAFIPGTLAENSIPLIWVVLSDEQMSNKWQFSLLNDEHMSNKLGVEHQPVINHCLNRNVFSSSFFVAWTYC